VLDTDSRDGFDAQKLGRFDPTVTGDDLIIAVDQNRIDESKFADGLSDLVDLFSGMNARVTRIGLKCGN
jgi:hypothetical protein